MSDPLKRGSWPGRIPDVRIGSLADIASLPPHVRFTPESGHRWMRLGCPLCANHVTCYRKSMQELAEAL